nr:hypothetical protein [Actinomycetospora corticicola]
MFFPAANTGPARAAQISAAKAACRRPPALRPGGRARTPEPERRPVRRARRSRVSVIRSACRGACRHRLAPTSVAGSAVRVPRCH